MTRWRVPFSSPELGPAERASLLEAFDSGWPSQGPRTREFEEAFARATGVRHAVAVSSGTAALHLALLSLRLAPGDEVIVPSLTFVATASAVVAAGGVPVFADVTSLDDPCISAASVEPMLAPRTRAIIAMHYGGMPCEMDALRRLASGRGLSVIEDAAHAVGALLDGRAAGSLSDAGCFSFHATKNLTTIEGGMITTDDAACADRVRALRSHGLTALSWERSQGASPDRDVRAPGLNYKMDDLRAAMGLAGLEGLVARNARRSAIAQRYREAVAGSERLALAFSATRPGRVAAPHLASLLISGASSGREERAELVAKFEHAGVQTSHHYVPAHHLTAYRGAQRLPITEAFAERQITLPLFSTMTDEQVELTCALLT